MNKFNFWDLQFFSFMFVGIVRSLINMGLGIVIDDDASVWFFFVITTLECWVLLMYIKAKHAKNTD